MVKEKVKFLRRDNLWIIFLMDCKYFEYMYIGIYIYIKNFLVDVKIEIY